MKYTDDSGRLSQGMLISSTVCSFSKHDGLWKMGDGSNGRFSKMPA